MKYLLALLTIVGLGLPASAQQWLPGGPGAPIVCVYNASPPTVATGNFVYAQCSSNGTLAGGGGGGGGAVTLASGAVASGAYSAGSMAAGAFVSGSFVAGALADGAVTTLGTEADTAWTSGSGTAIAILKKIATNTAAFSGAVTISGPLGTQSIAGSVATTIADGANVTQGSEADTAWSGTGNSTVVAALKAAVNGINAGYDSGTNSTRVNVTSQYPLTAVPVTASATGTTAATTATLINVSGHTTYICGYSIRANATAATTVLDTITGIITATMSSELWVAPAASGLGVDEQIFSPCIPASAVSTSISIVSGAPGAGGLVSVKAWGYSL